MRRANLKILTYLITIDQEEVMNLFETKKDKAKKIAFEAKNNAEAGHFEKAIEIMNYAITLDPQNSIYNKVLAGYYFDSGNLENAIVCLEKAFRLNKHSDASACSLGYLYHLKNDLDKSLYFYKKAFEINKKNPENKIGYARALSRCDRFTEAEPIYEEILQSIESKSESINEYRNSIYHEAAGIQIKLGNNPKAIKYLEKSLEVWKDDQYSATLLTQIKNGELDGKNIYQNYLSKK
jgi:tetratricopeptide (TPR) repeat protein